MGLIKFISNNFFSSSFSIFSWLKTFKSVSLYPYNFIFFEIFRPLATASEVLIPEKLPGPWFTITAKFLSNFT